MNEKIKIIHILDSLNIGGLENGIVNLINGSDDNEFIHEICCLKRSGAAAKRIKKNIKIYELNKKEGNDWGLYYRLVKLIKRAKPDIIHTRNWGAIDGLIAAKIAGVKKIIHGEHGWNNCDPKGMNKKRRIIRKGLSVHVDRFIAVSHDLGSWLRESCWIKSEKISTIINGVDVEKYNPKGDGKRIRSVLGLKDEVILGTVGRLDPIKNFDILIQAFSELKYGRNKVKLLIAGEGKERKKLERIASETGVKDRVVFLGERDDLSNIYKIMDVFILPSRNEGISNTILEAMATGIPVIAAKVGGNVELIEHNITGLLVSPESADAIKKALSFYLTHPEIMKEQGRNARNKAVTNFSLSKMINDYSMIYKQ